MIDVSRPVRYMRIVLVFVLMSILHKNIPHDYKAHHLPQMKIIISIFQQISYNYVSIFPPLVPLNNSQCGVPVRLL